MQAIDFIVYFEKFYKVYNLLDSLLCQSIMTFRLKVVKTSLAKWHQPGAQTGGRA
jgi:hypothetical protein